MSTTATAVSGNPLSQVEREQAHEHLRQAQASMRGALQGLSDAQWNFVPEEGRWSISQIAEHVIFVYERVEGRLKDLGSAPPPPERDHAMIDAITLNAFPNRIVKFTAPPPLNPSGCYPTVGEALARLRKVETNYAEMIDSAEGLRQHSIDSPPLKAVTKGEHTVMDGYQTILAASAHAERHVKQILEVRAHADFPVR